MFARLLTGLLVCTLVLGALPAHAQEDVQRYLTAAARLYENLEYERALDQLKRARGLSRGVDDDVTIALYEGIILADMGKKDDSRAAFKEGLFLKPDAQLPVKVSPKVTADFEAVRTEVKKEMAPILAKQEAERKKKEEEARKAEADRRAAEDKAKADEAARQKALADQYAKANAEERARIEAQRRKQAEADAEAARKRQAELDAQKNSDQPRDRVLVVQQDHQNDQPYLPGTEKKVEHHTPVGTFVLGGIALAAAGTGTYFGLQSKSDVTAARGSNFQDDTDRKLRSASDNATIANVAFGVAGAAAIGALVTFLVGGSDAAPAPAEQQVGSGGGDLR
ncbi:MAG: hypothetical protein ACJ790_20825 [Myxococcaceae bacterium]